MSGHTQMENMYTFRYKISTCSHTDLYIIAMATIIFIIIDNRHGNNLVINTEIGLRVMVVGMVAVLR